MTVTTTTNIAIYQGNGATVDWPFRFIVLEADHLQVQRRKLDTGEIVQTYTASDYTLSGLGDSAGGTLTLLGTPLDSDHEIIIGRIVDYTQELDIENEGGFFPEVMENQFDLQEMQIQQLREQADRAVRVPFGESTIELPRKSLRQGKVVGFDSAGALEMAALSINTSATAIVISDRTTLANLTPSNGQTIYLSDDGRAGWFKFDSSDLSTEVGDDPRQGIYVAPTSDATGASGAWKRIFLGHLDVKWFGALGDAVADDTAAIQATVNYASKYNFVVVFFSAGYYLFDNIYLNHDGTDNPDFNATGQEEGHIRLMGAGQMTETSHVNGLQRGTVLKSTSSVGNAAIEAVSSSGVQGQHVRIENMSIIVTNSTKAVHFERMPQHSGLSEVLVVQLGSGGGVTLKDTYNSKIDMLFIVGTAGTALGDGFYCYHENNTAGFHEHDTIHANGFANGVIYGHKVRTSAERMHGVNARNIQGADASGVGVTIGGGIASSVFYVHMENNGLGLKVYNGARNAFIRATCANNNKDAEFGSTTATENHYSNLVVQIDCPSDPTNLEHVEVLTASTTKNLTFENPRFAGSGTVTAFVLQDAVHHGLKIRNPIAPTIGTLIDHPEHVQELIQESSEVRRSVTSALSDIPFQWIQGQSAGAQPVGLFEQVDVDQPFFKLKTPSTVALNRHIESIGTGAAVGPGADKFAAQVMLLIGYEDNSGSNPIYICGYRKP